jgi:superfamily II DNA or RNA helicase
MRGVTLPLSFAGPARSLCEEALYPLGSKAQIVHLVSRSPDIQNLWALTCGLGPLVKEDKQVCLVIIGAAGFPEVPKSIEAFIPRFSILSSLYDRGMLQVVATSDEPSLVSKFLGNASNATLLTNETDTIAALWSQPLDPDSAQVSVKFKWSFGDPHNEVVKAKRAIDGIKQDEQSGWRSGFVGLLEKIPAARQGFEESFETASQSLGGVQLFAHQKQAIRNWLENGRHGIFKMCTGSGKTITALAAVAERAHAARAVDQSPLPVIVSVPTRVLADQWCREIRRLGFPPPLQAYNAAQSWLPRLRSMLRNHSQDKFNFVVTTYKTFGDQRFTETLHELSNGGVKALWVADEMHNLASARLLSKMENLQKCFSERIGLSATPEIEDNASATRRLFSYFERGRSETCGRYELADGIRDKVLCEYSYFPFPQYLKPENSERFMDILRRLEEQEDAGKVDIDLYRQKREILRTSGVQVQAFSSILEAVLKKSNKELSHTLVYCPPGYAKSAAELDPLLSDDEADEAEEQRLLSEIVAVLNQRGITVASILGETPQREREQILKEFRAGDIQVLCAISCLDEGVDVPGIDKAIILYSVDRAKQFIQRRGRILRRDPTNPGKTADIHDVIILPQGSHLPPSRRDELLKREIKRYSDFARFANNKDDADEILRLALATAAASDS